MKSGRNKIDEEIIALIGGATNVFAAPFVETDHPRMGGRWVDKDDLPRAGVAPAEAPTEIPGGDKAKASAFADDEQQRRYEKQASMLGKGAPVHQPGQPIPKTDYGYWVSPRGHYHPVPHQAHEGIARHIAAWRSEKIPKGTDATAHLMNGGWARVIHDGKGTHAGMGKGHRHALNKHLQPLFDHSLGRGKPVYVESHAPDAALLKSAMPGDYKRLDRWMTSPSTDYAA